jgi:hypothetical protein
MTDASSVRGVGIMLTIAPMLAEDQGEGMLQALEVFDFW